MNLETETQQEGGGAGLVSVSLGRNGGKGFAVMYRDDYEFLKRLGLSTSWNTQPWGYVIAPAYLAPGGQISVARVLLNAGPGQIVRYRDGVRTNLKRENLELVDGNYHTRRDRDYLTPDASRRMPRRKATGCLVGND